MKLHHGDRAAREVSERIAAPLATTAALTAIPAANRVDGMLAVVTADNSFWQFAGSSTATAVVGRVLAPDAGDGRWVLVGGAASAVRYVRGVVYANVADLAAFTVAGSDGLTYAAGQRVLLANQTTAAQCGIYVVGTVGGGTAPLVRAPDFFTGATVVNGTVVEVSEGTLFAGSSWKAMCTGTAVIGTNDPVFYPRNCRGTATLVAGLLALGSTQGLYVFSTTRSAFQVTRNTANTSTATTGGYAVPVAGITAGKSGTAAATLTAQAADGTTNTADISTLHWSVTNW